MNIIIEAMYCFVCGTITEHVIRRAKSGEIISHLCRRCKHTHVVGSNDNV